MGPPWYRDIQSGDIPQVTTPDGVTVRVIAGESHGVVGAVQRETTEPVYLDVHLPAGTSFEQSLPAGHNAFVHVYRGSASVGGTPVPAGRMAILANASDRDGVAISAGEEDTRVLLIAGRPLGEPIVQYGPFVMNSKEEIFQAVEDFQAGRFAA
jgi:redox-sensitive bicupin YhaK (pirin superfamily)